MKAVAEQTASVWATFSFIGARDGFEIGGGAHYAGKSHAADDLDLFGDGRRQASRDLVLSGPWYGLVLASDPGCVA